MFGFRMEIGSGINHWHESIVWPNLLFLWTVCEVCRLHVIGNIQYDGIDR